VAGTICVKVDDPAQNEFALEQLDDECPLKDEKKCEKVADTIEKSRQESDVGKELLITCLLGFGILAPLGSMALQMIVDFIKRKGKGGPNDDDPNKPTSPGGGDGKSTTKSTPVESPTVDVSASPGAGNGNVNSDSPSGDLSFLTWGPDGYDPSLYDKMVNVDDPALDDTAIRDYCGNVTFASATCSETVPDARNSYPRRFWTKHYRRDSDGWRLDRITKATDGEVESWGMREDDRTREVARNESDQKWSERLRMPLEKWTSLDPMEQFVLVKRTLEHEKLARDLERVRELHSVEFLYDLAILAGAAAPFAIPELVASGGVMAATAGGTTATVTGTTAGSTAVLTTTSLPAWAAGGFTVANEVLPVAAAAGVGGLVVPQVLSSSDDAPGD
ncbi:MAG TPA: hypothetical protein VLJ37_12295, partial [bacterium]|nr:hypothetical protein [bacterium]